MIFIFDGDPVAKPRQTRSDKWKKRVPVEKYRGFADLLRLQLNVQGWQKINPKPVALELHFYISPPKKLEKQVRESEQTGSLIYHNQKPDIDNLIKSVLDALYEEDKTVHTITAKKFYRIKPGIRIQVLTTY